MKPPYRYGLPHRFPTPVQPPDTAFRGLVAVIVGMYLGALIVLSLWP